MSIIGRFGAPFFFGLASSKYVQGKYRKAARLYEKAILLDPQGDNMEYSYLCLGRCYKEIGRFQDAFTNFSKAYEMYIKKKSIIENDFKKKEVKEMLLAYISMLKSFGKAEEVNKVVSESKKIGIDIDNEEDGRTSYFILPK